MSIWSAICPACAGNGCGHCGYMGYVEEEEYGDELLPEDLPDEEVRPILPRSGDAG